MATGADTRTITSESVWKEIGGLHILYWNVNSVNYRKKELETYIREKDPHILLIAQTCLGVQCQQEMAAICGKKYKSLDSAAVRKNENESLREVIDENKKVVEVLRKMVAENSANEMCEVADKLQQGNTLLEGIVDSSKKMKKASKGVVVVYKKNSEILNVGQLIVKSFDEQLNKKFNVTTFEYTSALLMVKSGGQKAKLVLFICIYRLGSADIPTIEETDKFCFELTTLINHVKFNVCQNVVLTGNFNFHFDEFVKSPEGVAEETVRRKLADLGFHIRNDYNEKTYGAESSWSCLDFAGISVCSPTGSSPKATGPNVEMTTPKTLNGNNGTEKLVDKKNHYAISFDLDIKFNFKNKKPETDGNESRKESELYLKEQRE